MWVILRPLGKSAWSGIKNYRNCTDTIGPYLTRSGRVYTGLTAEDADRLGKQLGLDLTPNSDFWIEWSAIRAGNKDLYFNTDDPMDELRYLFLKNHKRVAGSIFEKKSTADYVLINKEEEAKKANIFNKVKRRAAREFDRMSAEDHRKCLRLFGQNASNMGAEQAENVLFDIVDSNPQKFLDIWVDNKDRDTAYLIEAALSKNILRKTKNIYRYGTDIVGYSLDDVIAYLSDPKNQDLKLAIMNEIGGKDEFLVEKSEVIEPPWGDDKKEKDTEVEIEEPKKSRVQKRYGK
jgi:hypothetical protein